MHKGKPASVTARRQRILHHFYQLVRRRQTVQLDSAAVNAVDGHRRANQQFAQQASTGYPRNLAMLEFHQMASLSPFSDDDALGSHDALGVPVPLPQRGPTGEG